MTAPNRATRREVARVAARPPGRTVDVTIDSGAFAGWHATARADFPMALLAQLESNRATDVLEVLTLIVTDHNLPNSAGELAGTLAEVDPYDGLLTMSGRILEAIGSLPPR